MKRDAGRTIAFVLSRREQVVLELLAEGLTYSEIAERLVVSKPTIKAQVTSILRKLEARNAAHAVAIGYQQQMLMRHPVLVWKAPFQPASRTLTRTG